MFEDELQSLGKISENMKQTQKSRTNSFAFVEGMLIDSQEKIFNNPNLTI